MAAAKEAVPHLKLWPEIFIVLKPALASADLTCEMKYPLDRGAMLSWVNSGDSGGSWECLNKHLRGCHSAGACTWGTSNGDCQTLSEGVHLRGWESEDDVGWA